MRPARRRRRREPSWHSNELVSAGPLSLRAQAGGGMIGATCRLRRPAEFEARESEVRYQLNELTKGVAFYKRLGLEFEKIHDDKLRLVFTLIDAAHPTRPFSFNVRVSEGDAYEVDSVEPPVAGVADLVRSLNATNNFSGFVQAMRAKFVALAASGGGAAAVAGGAGGW